jgi:Protein of unknown function (DUF2568)
MRGYPPPRAGGQRVTLHGDTDPRRVTYAIGRVSWTVTSQPDPLRTPPTVLPSPAGHPAAPPGRASACPVAIMSLMESLKAMNLALKFLLELAAVAAFAYWGAKTGHGVLAVMLAIVAPMVAIVLWGVFAAPRSDRRLAAKARIPFELAVFGLAVAALAAVGSDVAALVLAVAVVVNAVLMTVFHQWER